MRLKRLRVQEPLPDMPARHSILRLFKLLRVLRSSRVLQRMQDSTNVNYGYLTLLKFAATYIFIAHSLACLPVPSGAKLCVCVWDAWTKAETEARQRE